jgi:hypothetical protein
MENVSDLLDAWDAERRATLELLKRAAAVLGDFTVCDGCGGKGSISVAAERKRYDCDECRATGYSYVPHFDEEVGPVLRDLRAEIARRETAAEEPR